MRVFACLILGVWHWVPLSLECEVVGMDETKEGVGGRQARVTLLRL